jgi:hypothetical protein
VRCWARCRVCSVPDCFALRAISFASVSLQLPGFMDEGTAGNTSGQLVGGRVWVQVTEIVGDLQRIQNSHASDKRSMRHINPSVVSHQQTVWVRA